MLISNMIITSHKRTQIAGNDNMHLLGFCVSFAFLTVAFIFGVVAISTNAWWKNDEIDFKGGLWHQCYKSSPCFEYGSKSDRSFKKLLNAEYKHTGNDLLK